MNLGDIKRHVGTVTAAYDDMSVSAIIDGLALGEIDDIRPELLMPLRWRPREGDRVIFYQRAGALRPEVAITWVGWAYDTGDEHLVPPWMEAGSVDLVGESGRVQIRLDDDRTADGTAAGTRGTCHLGFKDADEPLVLGNVYKAAYERLLDELAKKIAADNVLFTGLDGLLSATFPGVTALFTAWRSAVVAKLVPDGLAVLEQLVGPTVPAGADIKTLLPDHLSNYTFASKDPDPDPFTNETEDEA